MVDRPSNVAVVHDWLVDYGGAERVLEQILALYPDATLYTLIDRMPQPERGRFPSRRTVTSFLDRWPGVARYFTRCLPLMPFAVQQFDLSGHDLVISSSHCVAKGVIVPPDALHLCYCYSPMRYVWDMQATYLQKEGLDRGVKGWLARRLFHRLRLWDASSHNGVDHFAACSSFVQRRILKCWRRPATVIHPPVRTTLPGPTADGPRQPGRLITVGRLIGYKNVALMLDAMRLLPDHELLVVGTGPLAQALRRRAPANVRFTGYLDDAEVAHELRLASAFLFAAVEDFGIAPVEALTQGTPVIALARGGALDYLHHGDNAWLFDEATPHALAAAVRAASGGWPEGVAARCRASAAAFGDERFRRVFTDWVQGHWAAWRGGSAPPPETTSTATLP